MEAHRERNGDWVGDLRGLWEVMGGGEGEGVGTDMRSNVVSNLNKKKEFQVSGQLGICNEF